MISGSPGSVQCQDGRRRQQPYADVRRAFSGPFWPFVLASTSVRQEGIDFTSVIHWNVPGNPVATSRSMSTGSR